MRLFVGLLITAAAVLAQSSYNTSRPWWDAGQNEMFPWDSIFENSTGQLIVSSLKGSFRTDGHPFFQPLGSNGRACVTCHQPSNAMSLSVETIRRRWVETNGKDPLFAAVDGSNCPTLPQQNRESHSLLLDRGLFRVALPWPPKDVTPEFQIEVVKDPTGCNANPKEISVYRRPRMSANLTQLVEGPSGPVLMSDGRAPSLRDQAIDAAMVHEEAKAAPDAEALKRILEFETQIIAVQHADNRGGLTTDLAKPAAGFVGDFRSSVKRGANLFDTKCASCHQPGTQRWKAMAQPMAPDLPVFKVTCKSGKVMNTQDPGRALITGKCEDVGAIVIPQFHGLASRAPYFHNGSADTLDQLVDSYRERLDIRFNADEKRDLVNYLASK